MSYLEYSIRTVPSGPAKILHLNWALILLLGAVACTGFLMLYSVAGGDFARWAEPQAKRFALGLAVMFVVAMVPIHIWRNISALAYAGALVLIGLILPGVTAYRRRQNATARGRGRGRP